MLKLLNNYHEIFPNLWLGNYKAANDYNFIPLKYIYIPKVKLGFEPYFSLAMRLGN